MFDALLDRASRQGVRKRRVPLAAVDGTGNLLRGYRKSLREYKSQPDPAESLLEQLRRAVIDPY
jgi:hypothetical protein